MKKVPQFEPLHSSKFEPLSTSSMVYIQGGKATPGNTYSIHTEFEIRKDGKRYQRSYIKSYSADDFTEDAECYTDLEYCWTEWVES